MNWLKKVATILGPRLVAAAAGMAAAKLAEKGVSVDPAVLIGFGMGTYATVHKVISSKVNPGDAASGRMATAQKEASDTGTAVQPAAPTN